jgi:hypothetical protein
MASHLLKDRRRPDPILEQDTWYLVEVFQQDTRVKKSKFSLCAQRVNRMPEFVKEGASFLWYEK